MKPRSLANSLSRPVTPTGSPWRFAPTPRLIRGSIPSWLLSFGLVMSVSTQLRFPSTSVGPGELLLFGWLIATLRQDRNWRAPAVLPVLLMFLLGGLSLSTGFILSSQAAAAAKTSVFHDAVSYLFCGLLAFNYVSLRERYAKLWVVQLPVAFLASTLVALLLGWLFSHWSGLDVLYGGKRWQHLSNNPNQFALMALPFPFFALQFIRENPKGPCSALFFFVGLLALALGWGSRSDALSAAWLVGGTAITITLLFEIYRTQPSQSQRPLYFILDGRNRVLVVILLIAMVVGSALQFRPVAAEIGATPAQQYFEAPSGRPGGGDANEATPFLKEPQSCDAAAPDSNQTGARYTLWHNALAAISRSPIVGFGPGAHSGFCGPFGGQEAHNSLLDWGTQAGALGVVVLLAYGGSIFYGVARRGNYFLAGMLISLGSFSMFHFTMRQPIFWIMPLLALDIAKRSQPPESYYQIPPLPPVAPDQAASSHAP